MNAPDKDLFDSITAKSAVGVRHAIKEGADVNARWHRDITPLQRASSQPLIVEQLLKHGANPDLADDGGATALHAAARHPQSTPGDRHDIMTALLKAGADPNARTHRGHTPLHDAATTPQETSGPVRQLLDAGGDPAARDELGNLPLHYAAARRVKGRAAAVGYLIRAHDSVMAVNEQNNSGKTPLHWAAARPGQDQAETISLLLDNGADPTVQDRLGNLPLHYAAAARGDTRPDAVSRLLHSGLRANHQNHSGNTPLHEAVSRAGEGQAKTIAQLLDAGADPTLANSRGQSPLDLAAELKNPVAQTILERRTNPDHLDTLRPDPDPPPDAPATAYHRDVAALLIRQSHQAAAPWQTFRQPGEQFLPQSLATGREYQGSNSLYLMAVAKDKGYSDPRWGTFEQIKAASGIVRKGEKSTKIAWWDFSRAKEEVPLTDPTGTPVLDTEGHPVLRPQGPLFRAYSVFNVEQTANMQLTPLVNDKPSWKAHQDADALIKAAGVKITHVQGGWSYYDRKTDTITLPSPGCLPDPESYYQAATRELAHATGHESRMNRETLTEAREAGPGSPPYEREELRAEIAAMMTNARLGVGHRTILDAGSCTSIANTIADNPMEFHFAARDAQKISDSLIAPIREQLQEKEQPDAQRTVPAPAGPSLSQRMSAYRQSIPADHVELEARPTTDLPNGPIDYKFQGHPVPQNLNGLTKEDFGYNQVVAHAPAAEVQNHLRSLPAAERPSLETELTR